MQLKIRNLCFALLAALPIGAAAQTTVPPFDVDWYSLGGIKPDAGYCPVGVSPTEVRWSLCNFSSVPTPIPLDKGGTGATTQPGANGTLGIPGPVFNVIGYGATGATKSTSDFNITGGTSTGTSSSAPFTSATTGNIAIGLWGPTGVLSGTYTSGLTVTGYEGETCLLTFTGGSGSGATATLYLTGPNTIYSGEPFLVSAPGTGYASAPTSASVTSGTASCTGTATVSSVIGGTLAQSTLTYVNATTVTLSPGATSTVLSGLIWFGVLP